jgi:uncharacterized protein (DUF488 family)
VTANAILTIGHSTHDLSTFLRLLRQHGVTAVADVRSVPMSRFTPQYNRHTLRRSLTDARIKYVFLGHELGARSSDPTCYVDGRVQYERLARTADFAVGIERLLTGARTERVAIMCAEQEPLDCHRTVLVARVLAGRGVPVDHIHSNGAAESHASAMDRLLTKFGLDQSDLLFTPKDRLDEALSRQERRIAYVDEELSASGTLRA